MTAYVIPPYPQAACTVAGNDALFPVRRVYCIGRNYADHAIEMGINPDEEKPCIFQKNAHNVDNSGVFPYPPLSQNVHHEIEMVVALQSGGSNIAAEDALAHVYGYGVGLDMTRRDLQAELKKKGMPWEIGKAFERSTPMSALIPASEIGHPTAGRIALEINGQVRQEGDLNQMILKVPQMIAYVSEFYELAAGDLILSGTPAGVGPVQRGDVLKGSVEGVTTLHVTVV